MRNSIAGFGLNSSAIVCDTVLRSFTRRFAAPGCSAVVTKKVAYGSHSNHLPPSSFLMRRRLGLALLKDKDLLVNLMQGLFAEDQSSLVWDSSDAEREELTRTITDPSGVGAFSLFNTLSLKVEDETFTSISEAAASLLFAKTVPPSQSRAFAASLATYRSGGGEVAMKANLSQQMYVILLFGGLGIVLGLATWGWRIIRSIGVKLAKITPSRGFCIELSTAMVVVVGSRLGIPLSTTHCQVGATVGVALLEGYSGVNCGLTFKIAGGGWQRSPSY